MKWVLIGVLQYVQRDVVQSSIAVGPECGCEVGLSWVLQCSVAVGLEWVAAVQCSIEVGPEWVLGLQILT